MLAIHDAVQAANPLSMQNGPTAIRITVIGELDTFNVSSLTVRVRNALDQHQPAAIDLDFDGVSFIDVAAAGELRRLHRHATVAGCELAVCAAQPAVWWLFNVTGLSSIFPTPRKFRLQSEPGS